LETIIRWLRIHALRGQVASSRLYCTSLARQFEASPSNAEKSKIANRYDEWMKRTHTMQFLLELLERQHREPRQAQETGEAGVSPFASGGIFHWEQEPTGSLNSF
jgi:hypothetical protein